MKTLIEVRETLTSMIKTAKALPGFRFNEEMTTVITKEIPAMLTAGNELGAIKRAGETITSLHAVLGAFIRYSVMPKTMPSKEVREGRFPIVVKELSEIESYDEDLIAGLNKKLEELKAAVNTEVNGSFDLRVAAYTAMHEAVEKAIAEQKRRDNVRYQQATAGKKAARAKADAEATERNKAHAQTQRQALLQQRQQAADSFANLL